MANCHECVFAGGRHARICANRAELGFNRLVSEDGVAVGADRDRDVPHTRFGRGAAAAVKMSIPSMEISKSVVAEAIPGGPATAASISRPTASMPSPTNTKRVFLGSYFP